MHEEQLHIRNLKNGDITAFDYLYNKWSGKLYNFVMKMTTGECYLAEEIVQQVFIKIWENKSSLDPEKTFSTFIFTIARNLLFNIYQKRINELLYQENLMHSVPAENTTEKEVEFRMLDEYINTLIEQLPPARKEVFILSRRHLYSNKEIAKKLNISENTVESQLRKAVSFLREKIAQHYNYSISLLALCLLLN
ncbi:MAG: RNA polymerase sigma-70 factor [Tannerellaceae bacterium]|jgi:RNA polymerase sigma-70 factor (ECF subfamily)|nr:RNA polymerase sigma-70 factor [Tannerellaceae bacterium]